MSRSGRCGLSGLAGQADLWGGIRPGFDNGEPFDRLEIAVAAKRHADSECGCSDPEVVLIEWKAAALLRHLDIRVLVTSKA